MYRPGRGPAPGFVEQSRQLTEARRAEPWLMTGSQNVQQQALRDLDQAWRNFFAGTHRRPGFREKDQHEGFRITGFTFALHVRKLNRRWSQVKIPKAGWVRFRRSRNVPGARSYRITRDRVGRWHVAFAVIPAPIDGPGTGEVTGIDRGVAVSLALALGETYQAPGSSARTERLARRLSRARRGSSRRKRAKARLARTRARDAGRRKDWAEKTSASIARRYDLIRIEDFRVPNLTRKPAPKPDPGQPGAFLPNGARARAGLNRGILTAGWGLFAQRLEQKAPGRAEKVHPAYTSQTCRRAGAGIGRAREPSDLRCRSCDSGNADVSRQEIVAGSLTAEEVFNFPGR